MIKYPGDLRLEISDVSPDDLTRLSAGDDSVDFCKESLDDNIRKS